MSIGVNDGKACACHKLPALVLNSKEEMARVAGGYPVAAGFYWRILAKIG